MGKTRIGNELKNRYAFYHIDLEEPQKNSSLEFVQFNQNNLNPELLLSEIKKRDKDSVITWGFYPGVHDPLVRKLQELGASMFWLDGDRLLAKEKWRNREVPLPDELFDRQVERIDNHNIQGIFSPKNLDTFDEIRKDYRDIDKIIKEIFGRL